MPTLLWSNPNSDCEGVMETLQLKHCPICEKDKPVSEFGICRARADGHNLYCKSCIRQKVTAQRRALKEYKALRKKHQVELEAAVLAGEAEFLKSKPVRLSPVDRVRLAIERGSRTQDEIRIETKLGKDEIGDALAVLILYRREVITHSDGTTRYYFIKSIEIVEEQAQRKDCVLSLSALGPVIKGVRKVA